MTPTRPIRAARPYDGVAVLGGGAWGAALAVAAARAGRATTLWCRSEATARDVNENRRNGAHLGDIPLPDGIRATTDMADALAGAEAALVVVPSPAVREVCGAAAAHLAPGAPLILCAKGIEAGTGLLMSEVAAEAAPGRPIGALSGPTFAAEAALGHLTAAAVALPFTAADTANPEEAPAVRIAVSLGSEAFRPYISDDVIGVEVGGAVKNVIAIACGMMAGAGFAENTRAALISRGLAEMTRLALALGGRRETLMGLSGAGDLTLTCSSTSSRNMSLGSQLGAGVPRAACFGGRAVTVEGERAAISVTDLARRRGVTMPICEAVRAILHGGAGIGETFSLVWSRPIAAEPTHLDFLIRNPTDEAALRRVAAKMPGAQTGGGESGA